MAVIPWRVMGVLSAEVVEDNNWVRWAGATITILEATWGTSMG
jgi:hypothetical protein